MRFRIEYSASETIDIPEDTPREIVQVIVEDIVEGAINFLREHRFEAELKKIKRNP